MSLSFRVNVGLTLLFAIPCLVALAILRTDDPQRALGAACRNGDLLQARVAILCGADIDKFCPGNIPNIVAAGWWGQVPMIEYLLSKGADIETKDKGHGTALSRAAQNGKLAAVQYLLAHWANPNTRDNEGGNTPWDLAAMNHKNRDPSSYPNYQQIAASLKKAGGQTSYGE